MSAQPMPQEGTTDVPPVPAPEGTGRDAAEVEAALLDAHAVTDLLHVGRQRGYVTPQEVDDALAGARVGDGAETAPTPPPLPLLLPLLLLPPSSCCCRATFNKKS